jgi:hypothetical protein
LIRVFCGYMVENLEPDVCRKVVSTLQIIVVPKQSCNEAVPRYEIVHRFGPEA